jgi:cephalosporin-C deacetylase-like acetyl esterase
MAVGPGSEQALLVLLEGLGVKLKDLQPSAKAAEMGGATINPDERQQRQVSQLVEHTQKLLRESERNREQFFWNQVGKKEEWLSGSKKFKDVFWEEVLGRLPKAMLAPNARSRKILDESKWTGHDIVLDVYPDVYAWGVLLLPKDLKPGERRPVVVCQHGLEGVPMDTITADTKQRAYEFYRSFAARLAEQGFVVFAPHNPYRGQDKFRVLQRKANPVKQSLFSVILAQHERILDWLAEQPFVDPARIGFYGLSYGGKTAMRVPALLDRYCLSICSADFNEWIKKNATTESAYSYLFTGEYEMPEFNLGQTFNYAEMAALIAPRPFMVERGHRDGVAPDEWVAYEFAKVRRFYAQLGIPERTEIEFFNGPHSINGKGTFRFLNEHLRTAK